MESLNQALRLIEAELAYIKSEAYLENVGDNKKRRLRLTSIRDKLRSMVNPQEVEP